jgi:hypothetical protein
VPFEWDRHVNFRSVLVWATIWGGLPEVLPNPDASHRQATCWVGQLRSALIALQMRHSAWQAHPSEPTVQCGTLKLAWNNEEKIMNTHLWGCMGLLWQCFLLSAFVVRPATITRKAKEALHVKCHTLTSFMNSSGDLPYILLKNWSSFSEAIMNSPRTQLEFIWICIENDPKRICNLSWTFLQLKEFQQKKSPPMDQNGRNI